MNWIVKAWVSLLVVTISCGVALADDAKKDRPPSELDLNTQRVVVFKDGYCMVLRNGTATTDGQGRVFTDEVPDAAVLGSFWVLPTTDGVNLQSTIAGWEDKEIETTQEVDCLTTFEILGANVGKECTFEYLENKYRGEILKVLTRHVETEGGEEILHAIGRRSSFDTAASTPRPSSSSRTETSTPTPSVRLTKKSGEFFLVRTDEADMLVPCGSVDHLSIAEMASTRSENYTETIRQKRLTLQFDQPNAEIEVSIMYFRPGVRWIPTYRIELTDQPFETNSKNHPQPSRKGRTHQQPGDADKRTVKRARWLMQGEIINDAEDLIDMPIDVVVGVPNFRFRDVASPMTLEETLRGVVQQMSPNVISNGRMQQMSNALYTQRASEFQSSRAAGGQSQSDVQFPKELATSGSNDLFVYTLPKMSLKRGERATVPILVTEVPYRDVYTWDIHVKHSGQYAATAPTSSNAQSPLVLSQNQVWRQVELVNETDIPWTTGAAIFMDEHRPLAQDLLTYTSPGGICRVPVTVAVDLRGKTETQETGRELNALAWRSIHYAKITGETSIELASYKREAVTVEVRMRTGGKVTSASDNGTTTLGGFQQDDWLHWRNGDPVNNSSRVLWKSTIQPGECFKPTVGHEFFLRY